MIADFVELGRAHAPILIIATTMIAAALALCAPSVRLAWVTACAGSLLAAMIAGDFAWRTLVDGATPVLTAEGVFLRGDALGAWIAAMLTAAGALTASAGGATMRTETHARSAPLVFALLLMMIAAWCAAGFAGSFVGLIAAAATAWLASVGMVALSADRTRGALTGALRMLAGGAVAIALMLIGAALLGRGAGALTLVTLASAPIAAPALAAGGVGLILAGLAFQAGIAPLHMWAGPAYGRAGGLAAIALGAVGTIGALAVLVRVAAFAFSAPSIAASLSPALLALGAASVVIGSVQAVGARNIRRLVAYAVAAQAGCALISAALGSPAGFAAALVQILAQCAAALSLLAGAARVVSANDFAELDGLARRAPLASAAIMAGALSLMGAPLTLGFLGRWRLIEAGVGGGWWWSASAVIVVSLAAVLYGGRLIERIYFRRAEIVAAQESPWRFALWPALLASMAAIAFGVEPSLILRAADVAAAALAGASP